MADDIINSGNTGAKKTTAQLQEDYANTSEKLNKDYAAASEVMNAAGAELQHGREQNTEFSNSGLNTTVAKDSKGNTIGTYDWEAQAEHTAKISYNSDVLSAKQDAAAAKQELVANQQQGQTQYDMAGYSANQSAEKAGWTGGYVLDSNRQVAFLKESIKANLYSQEELQKYGYDTALAAARANYDLKKSELAMQNYNTAVQNAFQMAEFTGKFISPETSFHLSQRGVAEQILKDQNATEEDKAKANEVISSVNSWFKGNDISEEGVYCMSILMQNYAHASTIVESISNSLANNAEAWDKLNTMLATNQQAVDTANADPANAGMFSYVDEYGNIQKINANWAVAMTGTMPEGFNSWSSTAQADYKKYLGTALTADLKGKVETAISSKNFADEDSAKAAIHNAISDNIKNYGDMSDVTVQEMNFTVTINGTDMSIPITSSTVVAYKNTYEKHSDTAINYSNNPTTNLEGMGSLSNEQMAEEAAKYIWSGNSIIASGNKKAHHGDDIKLTINGEKLDTKYEYDKDYGDTTGSILSVFFGTDTSSSSYKAAQAILQNMSNDSYAVIPILYGNNTKYVVAVKDMEGHYSYLRDKSAKTEGSKEVATSKTIQDLAAKILAAPHDAPAQSNIPKGNGGYYW